jgi:hypothetical protein
MAKIHGKTTGKSTMNRGLMEDLMGKSSINGGFNGKIHYK